MSRAHGTYLALNLSMGRFREVISILLGLTLTQLGCGEGNSTRTALSKPSGTIQNLLPPTTSDSLKISLLTKIDDNGNRTPSISVSLKNDDGTGRLWSSLLGERFKILIGSSEFVVQLNEDGIYSAVPRSLEISEFRNLFGQSVRLARLDNSLMGISIEAQKDPKIPPALSNFSQNFLTLEDRLSISRCRIHPRDPAPGIYWQGSSAGEFEIQIGSYIADIPDIGYWLPSFDLFYYFYFWDELEWADYNDYILDPVQAEVGFKRHFDNQGLRLLSTLQRDLVIKTFVLESANYNLVYVGGCAI